MKGLQVLQRLEAEDIRKRYPSFPYPPSVKHSDKTANGLTRAIIRYLCLTGHHAERVNNMGKRIDHTKVVTDTLGNRRLIGSITWIPSTGVKGTADIHAVISGGRSLFIEVKIGKDRQSSSQVKFQKEIEAVGALYYIAQDFQSFYEWFDKLLNT